MHLLEEQFKVKVWQIFVYTLQQNVAFVDFIGK